MENRVIVRLENVSKKYGNTTVIENISLDIYEGEFITLLGSSGCGKTTILRMISGLENVTSGKVYIDEKDVTNVDPTKREVNTIFQNFALFPKMTVNENITFGLRMKKVKKEEMEKRCANVIKLVKLEGFEDRYPSELSGGQQQRVAIARGIIMNPKVLLLDESLCSLDLKLKKSMQIELKRIQKKLGITFIYVTHNQEEALSMSDRIVIINKGNIEQIGTPQEIYKKPKNVFVADFIGDANIIEAEVIKKIKDGIRVSILDGFKQDVITEEEFNVKDKIKVVIRPEDVMVSKRKSESSLEGTLIDSTYSGDDTKLLVDVPGKDDIKATVIDDEKFNYNDKVYIVFNPKTIIPLRK